MRTCWHHLTWYILVRRLECWSSDAWHRTLNGTLRRRYTRLNEASANWQSSTVTYSLVWNTLQLFVSTQLWVWSIEVFCCLWFLFFLEDLRTLQEISIKFCFDSDKKTLNGESHVYSKEWNLPLTNRKWSMQQIGCLLCIIKLQWKKWHCIVLCNEVVSLNLLNPALFDLRKRKENFTIAKSYVQESIPVWCLPPACWRYPMYIRGGLCDPFPPCRIPLDADPSGWRSPEGKSLPFEYRPTPLKADSAHFDKHK